MCSEHRPRGASGSGAQTVGDGSCGDQQRVRRRNVGGPAPPPALCGAPRRGAAPHRRRLRRRADLFPAPGRQQRPRRAQGTQGMHRGCQDPHS